jgi:hypothetical protein
MPPDYSRVNDDTTTICAVTLTGTMGISIDSTYASFIFAQESSIYAQLTRTVPVCNPVKYREI